MTFESYTAMADDELSILVINNALTILKSEDSWSHQSEYKENCAANAKQFSLGCAMEKAQLKHRQEKKNRAKEMRVLRRMIYRHHFWRAGIHPIAYFNKHHKTTFNDVREILIKVKQKLEN